MFRILAGIAAIGLLAASAPAWAQADSETRQLIERLRPGDVVLTLGAGDVTLVGPEVLRLLEQGP